MILRFLRWLARHEIEASYVQGHLAGQACAEVKMRLEYLRGHAEGGTEALLAVEKEAQSRAPSVEDVQRARRRMVH